MQACSRNFVPHYHCVKGHCHIAYAVALSCGGVFRVNHVNQKEEDTDA